MAPLDSDHDLEDATAAWAALSRSMESGISWSGNERNRAWLNMRDGTFVDVSAIAGFDQIEDGRVALRTDWDGDGDVDIWLRSRNGPTLRYLENTSSAHALVTFDIDPGVEIQSLSVTVKRPDGSTEVRDALVGEASTDGYLASTRLPAALTLAEDEIVTGVSYKRNGGSASMSGSGLGTRFHITESGFDFQGRIDGKAFELRDVVLAGGALAASPLPTHVVLRSPLPIPAVRAEALLEGASEGRIVIAKSATCERCEASVPPLVDALDTADLAAPLLIDVDDQGDARHGDFLHALAGALLGPRAELPLPLAIVLDADGLVQAIHLGELDVGRVKADLTELATNVPPHARTAISGLGIGARWFHSAPRSYAAIRRELSAIGLDADASVYAE